MVVGSFCLPVTRATAQPVVVPDVDAPRAHLDTVCFMAMTPETIEFLCNVAPHSDGFTRELEELREQAKGWLWERHS